MGSSDNLAFHALLRVCLLCVFFLAWEVEPAAETSKASPFQLGVRVL